MDVARFLEVTAEGLVLLALGQGTQGCEPPWQGPLPEET